MSYIGYQPRRAALAFCCFIVYLAAFSPSLLAATNRAPTISGTPRTVAAVGQTYQFQPAAHDANGDKLTFSIVNKPAWTSFSSSTGKLAGTPQSGLLGRTFTGIRIKVSDGIATTALPAFSITVKASNSPPKISGTPRTTATVGKNYYFRPTASDPNGDALTFSVSGKPAWAAFNTTTGALTGSPRAANVGTFRNIVISVSDGKSTTKLAPFAITVSSSTNHAPTISGAPVTSAKVGQPYAFKPKAADADGDRLTFAISGKPGWASFDTSNGTLYGRPAAANIGTFSNVKISVTDGKARTSLAPFSITVSNATTNSVTLRWVAPVRNADGTALRNLAGYKVFYGKVSRQYSNGIKLTGAGTTSVEITGLTSGTWYFAIKSYNTTGVYSSYSGEVKAVL